MLCGFSVALMDYWRANSTITPFQSLKTLQSLIMLPQIRIETQMSISQRISKRQLQESLEMSHCSTKQRPSSLAKFNKLKPWLNPRRRMHHKAWNSQAPNRPKWLPTSGDVICCGSSRSNLRQPQCSAKVWTSAARKTAAAWWDQSSIASRHNLRVLPFLPTKCHTQNCVFLGQGRLTLNGSDHRSFGGIPHIQAKPSGL